MNQDVNNVNIEGGQPEISAEKRYRRRAYHGQEGDAGGTEEDEQTRACVHALRSLASKLVDE